MDLLLAAQAKSRHLILVTNNEKEFRRIQGLGIENWTGGGLSVIGRAVVGQDGCIVRMG